MLVTNKKEVATQHFGENKRRRQCRQLHKTSLVSFLSTKHEPWSTCGMWFVWTSREESDIFGTNSHTSGAEEPLRVSLVLRMRSRIVLLHVKSKNLNISSVFIKFEQYMLLRQYWVITLGQYTNYVLSLFTAHYLTCRYSKTVSLALRKRILKV